MIQQLLSKIEPRLHALTYFIEHFCDDYVKDRLSLRDHFEVNDKDELTGLPTQPYHISETDVGNVRNFKVILNLLHTLSTLQSGSSSWWLPYAPLYKVQKYLSTQFNAFYESLDQEALSDTYIYSSNLCSEIYDIFAVLVNDVVWPIADRFDGLDRRPYDNVFNGKRVDHITHNKNLDNLLMAFLNARKAYQQFKQGDLIVKAHHLVPSLDNLYKMVDHYNRVYYEHSKDVVKSAKTLIDWLYRFTIDIDTFEERFAIKQGTVFYYVMGLFGVTGSLVSAIHEAWRTNDIAEIEDLHGKREAARQARIEAVAERKVMLEAQRHLPQSLENLLNTHRDRYLYEITSTQATGLKRKLTAYEASLFPEEKALSEENSDESSDAASSTDELDVNADNEQSHALTRRDFELIQRKLDTIIGLDRDQVNSRWSGNAYVREQGVEQTMASDLIFKKLLASVHEHRVALDRNIEKARAHKDLIERRKPYETLWVQRRFTETAQEYIERRERERRRANLEKLRARYRELHPRPVPPTPASAKPAVNFDDMSFWNKLKHFGKTVWDGVIWFLSRLKFLLVSVFYYLFQGIPLPESLNEEAERKYYGLDIVDNEAEFGREYKELEDLIAQEEQMLAETGDLVDSRQASPRDSADAVPAADSQTSPESSESSPEVEGVVLVEDVAAALRAYEVRHTQETAEAARQTQMNAQVTGGSPAGELDEGFSDTSDDAAWAAQVTNTDGQSAALKRALDLDRPATPEISVTRHTRAHSAPGRLADDHQPRTNSSTPVEAELARRRQNAMARSSRHASADHAVDDLVAFAYGRDRSIFGASPQDLLYGKKGIRLMVIDSPLDRTGSEAPPPSPLSQTSSDSNADPAPATGTELALKLASRDRRQQRDELEVCFEDDIETRRTAKPSLSGNEASFGANGTMNTPS